MRIETCSKCGNVPEILTIPARYDTMAGVSPTSLVVRVCAGCQAVVSWGVPGDVLDRWKKHNPPPPEPSWEEKVVTLMRCMSICNWGPYRTEAKRLLDEREKRDEH